MRLVRLWGPLVSGVLAGVDVAWLGGLAGVLGGIAAIIGATATLVVAVLDHRRPKMTPRQVERLVNRAVAEALKDHGVSV